MAKSPPAGETVKHLADDLFFEAKEEHQIDFENEGRDIHLRKSPYLGSTWQSSSERDLQLLFQNQTKSWKSLDYVSGWFYKAIKYGSKQILHQHLFQPFNLSRPASTNTLANNFDNHRQIFFAYTSFKWSNLASKKAGVTVVIIGLKRATH